MRDGFCLPVREGWGEVSGAGEQVASAVVSGPAALEVHDLTTRYGELTAVDHVSFAIEPGTITALLGPNGAGKTTTVETLEGYKRPTSGTVRVLGLDPIRDHRRLVPRIGVMLQDGGVYTGIKPIEVLRLFASYYDDPHDPDELLDRVGLSDRKTATWRRMSGGEKQRLSLALALIGKPDVAFLDEPTSGIDPTGRREIRDVVTSLRADGVTVLLTTHDLDEADRLADRVLIIDHGRLLADGTPNELRTQGQVEELRFAATAGIDVASLGQHLGATVAEVSPGEYLVALAADPSVVASLTAWLAERSIPLGDLRAQRQSLEDVFLKLTEQ
jgi:ABC-2 type transport system ATP-binding protein